MAARGRRTAGGGPGRTTVANATVGASPFGCRVGPHAHLCADTGRSFGTRAARAPHRPGGYGHSRDQATASSACADPWLRWRGATVWRVRRATFAICGLLAVLGVGRVILGGGGGGGERRGAPGGATLVLARGSFHGLVLGRTAVGDVAARLGGREQGPGLQPQDAHGPWRGPPSLHLVRAAGRSYTGPSWTEFADVTVLYADAEVGGERPVAGLALTGRVRTAEDVRVGDALARAARAYRWLTCALVQRGSDTYPACSGRLPGRGVWAWFGGDPIANVTVANVPLPAPDGSDAFVAPVVADTDVTRLLRGAPAVYVAACATPTFRCVDVVPDSRVDVDADLPVIAPDTPRRAHLTARNVAAATVITDAGGRRVTGVRPWWDVAGATLVDQHWLGPSPGYPPFGGG